MKKFTSLFTKISIAIVTVYGAIGFIILPYFIQFYIPTIVKNTINTESYLDSVHCNPFTFDLKINNLILKDQHHNNLLFFETLNVNIDPFKLLFNELHLSNIMIDNLTLAIDIDKNKKVNFQYILDTLNKNNDKNLQSTKDEKTDNNLLFTIANMNLSKIHFVFKDYSKEIPFIVQTRPISLISNDIQVKPNHTNKFDFVIDTHNTGKISLVSNIVTEPLSITGDLKLENIAVNKIFHYIKPSDVDFDVDSYPLNLSFDYQYLQNKEKQNINLQNINLHVDRFSFIQKPYTIQLKNLQHNIDKTTLQIDNNTTYNLSNIKTAIDNINFIDIHNNSNLEFHQFINTIEQINNNKKETINIKQTLNTPTSGTIQAKIEAIQEPLGLNIDLTTKDIAIKPYQSYIKQFVNLDLNSGFLSNNGKIKFSNENNQTNLDLTTNLTLKKLDIVNSTNKQQLIKIDTIDMANLHYKNDALLIKKIGIEKPYIYFALNENNTTNFSNIIPQTKEKTTIKEKKNTTQQFSYQIDTIAIANGHSLFEDYTVFPIFSSKDTQISGDIKSLTSDKTKTTIITHSSIIDSYAPLLINTNITIADPMGSLNNSIKVENINLPSLSSYSGKFIGQTIANGKLSLTLTTDIKKSQLTSTNNIKIKDIELGEKVQSKDAINAPIGLAIALLEDSDGYIDLDIPIDGDINDPNFHLSDVILDVITNTIVGIVSAPFKFLALLVGLDGDDISNIEFDYGSYDITVTQMEKLDNIIKAFTKRPNLKLKIKPSYILDKDTQALQEKKLQEKYPFIKTSKNNFESSYKKIKNIFIKEFGEKNYATLEGEEIKIYQNMIEKLQNTITIEDKDLATLATQRAIAIQTYLLSKKLDSSRIIIDTNKATSNNNLKKDKALVLFEIEVK